jgi:hypothetical protein
MRMAQIASTFILAMVMVLARAQAPLNPHVEIKNGAKAAVKGSDVKPDGNSGWGENKLGGPLAPGKTISIREFTEANCKYQVRAVFDDGRTEQRPVDVCRHGQII